MKLTGGAVIVAGLAGLAYAVYKGWIKIPNILGLLPGDVGRGAQEVPGIPGAIGGATYNIFSPSTQTLKERAEELAPGIVAKEGIPYETAFAKGVAQTAAEDIITGPFGTGFAGAITNPLGWGYTIGGGLGAVQQWNRYLEGLPPVDQAAARQTEYATRAAWMYEHPIESTLGFGAQIIHEATKPPGAPSAPLFSLPTVAGASLKSLIFGPPEQATPQKPLWQLEPEEREVISKTMGVEVPVTEIPLEAKTLIEQTLGATAGPAAPIKVLTQAELIARTLGV